MGDEFGEVTEDVETVEAVETEEDFTPAEGLEEDFTSEEDVEEDFTPAEGLEEVEVEEEEIAEDTEEAEEMPEDIETEELEEDFTPTEGLEEDFTLEEDLEEDFTPAEGLEEVENEEEEIAEDTEEAEEMPEDIEVEESAEDFTPAEGLEEDFTLDEDVEEDFTPAEGLEEVEAEEEEIVEDTEEAEEMSEDIETTDTEEAEEMPEEMEITEAEEISDDMETGELEDIESYVEESPESEDVSDTSEGGGPGKVLKPDGDTSMHVSDYDEQIADLDKGIENAKQPYQDEANEINEEANRIFEDSEMTREEKMSSLEMDKERLTSLKEQWKDESSEWYSEKDRLRQMKEQQIVDDFEDSENIDDDTDMTSEELNVFSDKIEDLFGDDGADDVENISDEINDKRDINSRVADVRSPKPIEGMDAVEPNVDVFPLEKTKQTINNIELDDGTEQKVFDHPDKLLNELPFTQGINEFNKEGTCALANLGSWLEIGGSNNVENDIVKYASTHMDIYGDALCSESGGVLPQNIPTIWKEFGVEAYLDGSKNLEHIAEAVESGRAVSVGVNAGQLYENDNYENIDLSDCYGDGGANHAIGVMSCARDAVTGNLTHFYINDTGRDLARDACRKINATDFLQALNVKRGVAIISKKPIW